MNRSVWDDDKCHKVWEHLVTDEVYLWPWMLSTQRRFVEITGSSNEIVKSCSGSDLPSTHRLKSLVREILLSEDVTRSDEMALWIVVNWGNIKGGKDKIPLWMASLRPFNGSSIMDFISNQQTDRISSWSKILSFFDYDRHAVYDARTAIALNSAMELAGSRPKFHMPASQNRTMNTVIPLLKSKYKSMSSGYYEYIFLLNRFVEIGRASSILGAERAIFAGAEETAKNMMKKWTPIGSGPHF